MIVECKCGNKGYYNKLKTNCPNDIINQNSGWSQNNKDRCICPLYTIKISKEK